MIVVSNFGYNCMKYGSEFEREMDEAGYENPFTRRTAILRKKTEKTEKNGIKDTTLIFKEKALDESKIYISRDDWIDKREKYIANKIYQDWDWDKFINYIEEHNLQDILNYDIYKPCETGEHQCTMFCPHLGVCWLKEVKK